MTWLAWALAVIGAALVLAMGARAATPTSLKDEFEQRFTAVGEIVLDANGMFSFSEIYPKLEAIEELAQRIGTDSPERARTLYLMSLVRFKHEDYDDAIRLGDACLALKSVTAISPPDRTLLIHRVAKSAEHLHRYALAAERYRAVLDFDASSNSALLDDEQRLSILELTGYVLHEDGRYAQAFEVNQKVLKEAERLLGTDDGRLTKVLVNLAQNQYELHHVEEAEAALRRALALAQRSDNEEMIDISLFQLGVIAFERGDIDSARRWMKERVKLATQAQDPDRLKRAEDDAQELERRISKR